MSRQESTNKTINDNVVALRLLRRQVIDKDRTNALTNIAAFKVAIDALKNTLDATSTAADFDTLA